MAELGVLQLLPIGKLIPADDNPRESVGELEEMALSMRSQGVLEPLLVEPFGANYRIIAGERRWRAARKARLDVVPCIVRRVTNKERHEAMLVENLQRKNLTSMEQAKAFQKLVDEGYTQREIATRTGKSQSHISRCLLLLTLPAADRRQVAAGKVSVEQALGYKPAPAADVFDADDQLERAWRRLREDALELGDGKLLRRLGEFARAYKAYRVALNSGGG